MEIVQEMDTQAKSADERWMSGFNDYSAGLSVADLHDATEVRGWWAALNAESEAAMAASAPAAWRVMVNEVDAIDADDMDFFRGGWW